MREHTDENRNFAAGIYAASIPSIALNLKISEELAISGLSLFALGVGLGPVIAAPISEIFGRKVIYLFSLPLAMVFLAGAGAARNFQTIAVLRFLAGFAGSPVLAVGGGTIADVWDLKTEPLGGLMLVLFVTFILAGAELGPTAGGYIVENRGWRWAFWLPVIICGVVALMSLPVRETNKALILRRQAKRLGIESKADDNSRRFVAILWVTLSRAVQMLFAEPIVFLTSLYAAYTLAVFYLFYVAYPYILSRVYGFGLKQSGLAYISLAVGSISAILVAGIIDKTLYQRAKSRAKDGRPAPEARMYGAMVSLFW